MRRLVIPCLLLGLLPAQRLAGQTPDQPTDKPTPLTAETSVERELPNGGVHAYEVRLGRNDFLHVVIEQQGADVVVNILDQDGKSVVEQDTPVYHIGTEDLRFIAPSDGRYQLKLKAIRNPAQNGRYRLRVAALRPASADDQAFAAKQAQAQAANAQLAAAAQARQAGRYDEALQLSRQALTVLESAYGPSSPLVVEACQIIGNVYAGKTDYAEAERWYRRALAAHEAALGEDHPYAAMLLSPLGLMRHRQGDFAGGERLQRRALATAEKWFGPHQPETARVAGHLANLYLEWGRYPEAAALYQRIIGAWEAVGGPNAPELAAPLNSLGALYHDQGDYPAAEAAYLRSLNILEKRLGDAHPNLAVVLNNLAETLRERGDNARAEPLYQRALTILETKVGPNSPLVATILTNLGRLSAAQDQNAAAEAFFRRALAVYKAAFGDRHPRYAVCLNHLAQAFERRGDFGQAEELYRQALAISESALGARHPDGARHLLGLGRARRAQRDYAAADRFFQQALEIQTSAFGSEHPEVIRTLDHLAVLRRLQGEPRAALAFQVRANEAREGELARNLVAGSERQKFLYLALAQEETDRTISLHLQALPQDAAAARAALTVILQRKGRALDAMTDAVAVLRKRGAPEDAKLLDELTNLKAQISVLTQRGPGEAGPAAHRAELKALGERADALEADISRRSARYRARFAPVTLAAVTQAVPADAVLIEYAVYRPTDIEKGALQPARYAAYALKRDGALRWADLGDAATIDQAVADFRAALARPSSSAATVKRAGNRLAALVLQPLRPFLPPARRLLLSPDGLLNLVPFEALTDARGKYLVEQFDIAYLTSGRDLLALRENREPTDQPPVVFAAPDYGRGDTLRLAGMTLPPLVELTGTAAEAEAIHALFPGTAVRTRGDAAGDALRELRRPRFLHLATHGAFLEDARAESAAPGDATREIGLGRSQTIDLEKARSENPLLRSYLFFAGANQAAPGSALTALEAANLDLWGTQLVTLSACQTGVGAVRAGDGVYGMRRAFVLAGAQTQVMSLWSVSDQGTQVLMSNFYRRLKLGEERGAALRNARLEMLRRTRHRHPFYWASFILTGDWRPL